MTPEAHSHATPMLAMGAFHFRGPIFEFRYSNYHTSVSNFLFPAEAKRGGSYLLKMNVLTIM
jgi:hypothetical protein